jgi:hypothetical protein
MYHCVTNIATVWRTILSTQNIRLCYYDLIFYYSMYHYWCRLQYKISNCKDEEKRSLECIWCCLVVINCNMDTYHYCHGHNQWTHLTELMTPPLPGPRVLPPPHPSSTVQNFPSVSHNHSKYLLKEFSCHVWYQWKAFSMNYFNESYYKLQHLPITNKPLHYILLIHHPKLTHTTRKQNTLYLHYKVKGQEPVFTKGKAW